MALLQLTLTPAAPASGKASKPKKLASVFRSAVHLPGSSVIEVALDGSTTVQLLGEADFSVHAGSSTVMCRAPDTASRDRWVRAIASTIMG